ncbi:MAG: hypothetical protein WAU61_05410 [Smithella sp.]
MKKYASLPRLRAPCIWTFYEAFKGKLFNINFQRTQAVLNYEVSDGKWRQYVKKIKEEDYSFLIK